MVPQSFTLSFAETLLHAVLICDQSIDPSTMLSIIAGAYDGTLHGWQGTFDDMKLAFAFKAHESCIRSLDVMNAIACSAAADESVQIYDLEKRRVIDRMSGVHQDDVTAVAFAKDKDGDLFLITGDLQGKLFVWTVKDRKVIHELKGHKQTSPVTSIAVHPSGRVALSTARDNSLRMWDLVKAKPAPRIKLDDFSLLSSACWSPDDGARYAIVGDDLTVLIFDALSSSDKPMGLNKHPKRINAIEFVQDVVLVSGCDDGILRVLGADGSVVRMFQPESKCRLRDVACLAVNKEKETDGDQGLYITGAFSNGTIRVWDLNNDSDEPRTILNLGTTAHITSICIAWVKESSVKIDEANKIPRTKREKTSKNED
jgi:protein MAK11